jgi:hypothetical protein
MEFLAGDNSIRSIRVNFKPMPAETDSFRVADPGRGGLGLTSAYQSGVFGHCTMSLSFQTRQKVADRPARERR